ncbi:MAG: ATP-dependent helicase [Candidatus Omnitrophica bacterium]|nr:ATP-dependent helicase [Candidatus Omnitrophota bacterium]
MTKKYVLTSQAPPLSLFKIDYRKELNPDQYAVVTEAEGACLVLAGAGSGKTRTLVYRVAYLLEKGVRPEEILLVTFTNKAAEEMKNRIEVLLQTKAKGLWCGTFHHIGHRCLRMTASEAGLHPDFGILDEEDSRNLIKACIASLGRTDSDARFPKPGVVQSILSFSVNARQSLSDVVRRHYAYLSAYLRDFEKIKRLYDEKKQKTNNLDYDDLLVKWLELLQKSDKARERFTRQFRYCLVDEYQDTNRLQHELIRLLSGFHKNVLVVGDDAQSIYSFRAATVRNILDFPEDYEGTKVFKIETNYRSTKAVLELANASIRNNVHQFPKMLKSVRGRGALPQLVKTRDTRQEARFAAQRIVEFQESGVSLSDMAVLFRARFQAAELELELAKTGVPYIIRGGVRFFEQAHIKDALSFLRIFVNPYDEIAWIRALTLQAGIGSRYAGRIFESVEQAKGDLRQIASPSFGEDLPVRVRQGFSAFKKILKELLQSKDGRPDGMIEAVLEHGYEEHVLMNFENAKDRVEDLKELVNFAHTYKDIKDFLADVTLREGFRGESLLLEEEGSSHEELVLSTIHQAKGLEWKAVIVIGLAEGYFPHAKSSQNEEELEEERRLFYVAVTRAKEDLLLVHPMTRFDYQLGSILCRPSIFTAELPAGVYEEVEVEENETEKTIYLD